MTRFLAVPTAPAPWPFFDDPRRACRDVDDPEVFFPGIGGGGIGRARKYCERCPVADDCREWGIRYEPAGVWGGLSAEERDGERRRRAGAVEQPCAVCERMFVPHAKHQRACGSACARRLAKGEVA